MPGNYLPSPRFSSHSACSLAACSSPRFTALHIAQAKPYTPTKIRTTRAHATICGNIVITFLVMQPRPVWSTRRGCVLFLLGCLRDRGPPCFGQVVPWIVVLRPRSDNKAQSSRKSLAAKTQQPGIALYNLFVNWLKDYVSRFGWLIISHTSFIHHE